jgi:hypothetical protein
LAVPGQFQVRVPDRQQGVCFARQADRRLREMAEGRHRELRTRL